MQSLRDALRTLTAAPVVSLVAILSLALGIGANTAIFSILDGLVLKSLPVRDPQRLALLVQGHGRPSSWTNPIWEQIRDRQTLGDGAIAWGRPRFNLAQAGQTEFVDGLYVSGRFFDVLGVGAVLGRPLNELDDRRNGGDDPAVAVIGYRFWQTRFGGAGDILGRTLTLDRVPFRIVGVAPPGFFGIDVGRAFDVAVPLAAEALVAGRDSRLDRRSTWWLSVLVRLQEGQTIDQAAAAIRGVHPQIREATIPADSRSPELYLRNAFSFVPAATGASNLRSRYQQPLLAIMAIVAVVLLIACANVANLLLARAAARRHELSVRLALGASRLQLARQLLVESLALAGTGAAAGLLFARWGSQLLVHQLSTSTSLVVLDLSLDWRVLGFTAAVAIATAIVFGTAPAFRAARVAPIEAMKERGRGPAGAGKFHAGNALVVAQVALSLILLVAAGLFIRTFWSLARLDLGFTPGSVLIVNVDARRSTVNPADRATHYERLRRAIAAVPGVADAAASAVTPVSGSTWQYDIQVPGAAALPGDDRNVHLNIVTPRWFATYGTPILAGRDFTDADRGLTPRAAVVNETFARKFLAGRNPLGQPLIEPGRPGRQPWRMQIVGLARDAVYRSLREPVPPTVYVPLAEFVDEIQLPWMSSISLSLRSAGGRPEALTRSVAAAIQDVDRDLALTFRPLEEQVNASLIQERLVAMLSGFFGALAGLLAAIGLYGVTSYGVSRRRAEIGIRMALGAAPAGIVRMVLTRVAALVLAGIATGVAVSAWAAKFVATLLFALEPRDPQTFAFAAVFLVAIGLIAAWLPARRAAHVDAAEVLRSS